MIFSCKTEWVTMPSDCVAAPLFRKEFVINKSVKNAICRISGLGAYILTIDGIRMDDSLLNPRFSNYNKTVYYNEIELAPLSAGIHVLGICLGRSRYSMKTENVWGWHNPPWESIRKFIFQLDIYFNDGTSQCEISDGSWKFSQSPIRFDCLYTGEIFDANYELPGWDKPGYDDGQWHNSVTAPPPPGKLKLQTSPQIRPSGQIYPYSERKTASGSTLYTFKKNIAGNARVKARGTKGSEMKIHYGEKIFDDFTVNSDYDGVAEKLQEDKYIFASNSIIEYEPVFSYKGFRYVEIICDADVEIIGISGIIYHNELTPSGSFASSSDLINKIHENSKRALLSNLHHIPTDTPIYEKNGWTGDAQLTAPMAMYNFNINLLYKTWLDDFADAQLDNGELPPIIPSPGWGYSSSDFGWEAAKPALPAWDSAYFEITWYLYMFYKNTSVISRNYSNLGLYLEYLGNCAENFIVKTGLGDWLAPVGEDNSKPSLQPLEQHLSSTAYYFRMADIMAGFAGILGLDEDLQKYTFLADKIKKAFNNRYLDRDGLFYRVAPELPYRQTPNILPLAFGIAPDHLAGGIASNLNENILLEHKGHLWTGILGTRYIFEVLSMHGYIDTAFGIASKKTYPSWGYWIEKGAASLYEMWELDSRSRNHHMFGSIDSWFYSHLAGIIPGEPGFERIIIKPYYPSGLDSIKASLIISTGVISVEWMRTSSGNICLVLELPENTTAEFHNTLADEPYEIIPSGTTKIIL